jgi:hypothetical protein
MVVLLQLVADYLGQALLQALIGEAAGRTVRRLSSSSGIPAAEVQRSIDAVFDGPRLVAAVQIVSTTPGRTRLAVVGLRGDAALAALLEEALLALPGVEEAQANPSTGRLLLRFDPAVQTADTLRASAEWTRARLLVPANGRNGRLGAVV